MLNVRLAGGHLYGKQLFTGLSLVVSLMASFCAVLFFPLDVLDEIWDEIESVSEGFLTYSYLHILEFLIYKVPMVFVPWDERRWENKYLSWVYDVDRKIRHSGSLIGITRQPRDADQ